MSIKLKEDDSRRITAEEFKSIENKLDDAQESDTPFVAHNDEDSITVIGDANKTENKKLDLTITYRFRKEELEEIPEDARTFELGGDTYVDIDVFYDGMGMSVRDEEKLGYYAIMLYPYFKSLDELRLEFQKDIEKIEHKYGATFEIVDKKHVSTAQNKNTKKAMEDEFSKLDRKYSMEMYKINALKGKEAEEAVYGFIGTFLGVDENINDHMRGSSATRAMMKIIETYDGLFNRAETVFG